MSKHIEQFDQVVITPDGLKAIESAQDYPASAEYLEQVRKRVGLVGTVISTTPFITVEWLGFALVIPQPGALRKLNPDALMGDSDKVFVDLEEEAA